MTALRRIRTNLLLFAAGFLAAQLVDLRELNARFGRHSRGLRDREVAPVTGDGEGAPPPIVSNPDEGRVNP